MYTAHHHTRPLVEPMHNRTTVSIESAREIRGDVHVRLSDGTRFITDRGTLFDQDWVAAYIAESLELKLDPGREPWPQQIARLLAQPDVRTLGTRLRDAIAGPSGGER